MKFLPLRLRFPRFTVAVRFTKEGLLFVVLTLSIGAAAVNTGNNVLYLIFSLMLALIVVSGIISRRVLMGLSPSIEFPHHLFSGSPGICYVTVKNQKKKLPSVGIRFAVTNDAFPRFSRFFFYIPSNGRVSDFVGILFPRRGIFRIRELELQTRFPFNFFLKVRRYFLEDSVRIYPQIYRIPDEWIARIAEGALVESPYRGESHQLLHLRDYTSYDSSKRIHWKASAKSEKLYVKEFQREQGRELHVYFDCFAEKTEQEERMEKAISLLASFAYYVSEKNLDATFHFPDRHFRLTSGDPALMKLLDYLSELKTGLPDLSQVEKFQSSNSLKLEKLTLLIRSKHVPPILPIYSMHEGGTIFVEDWEDLTAGSSQVTDLKTVV
jgi:uncharacterized protein (DUF58 family)